ncbi:hypothetical protein BWI15_27150 [Kribbella sp. ALI-6-A]|uniref:hypothetical protein n=1 Tax=Kribbella sp. ALI-6-A TaxID=1933817 RepID=UPI00097C8811|nr:hypothetical protein [Kribbella sp. ALI-6-A]ONI66869.1 hypothetical protein BWI15_27150 [Kribbella sp. ALI-6-A]
MNDPTEDRATGALLTRALSTYADSAPTDHHALLATVHHRLRRRRRARAVGAGVLACTAVAAGVTGVGVLRDGPIPAAGPSVPAAQPASAHADGPKFTTYEGWHWESYGTVQVQVPDTWTDTFYSHLWSCRPLVYGNSSEDVPKTPQVGRPLRGYVPLIGCPKVPEPAERVPHLWFGEANRSPGVYRHDHGWLEEVRVVDGIHLSAFGNDPVLLRRILDSAQPIDGQDAYGCSPTAPPVVGEGRRPTGPGLGGIGEVESIRLCGYGIDGLPRDARLLAGGEIAGDKAREVVAALRAAPAGSGPNHEYHCETTRLRDDLLITVRGSTGEQEVSVRYNSCNHNGIDDGTTGRQLTREALLPLVTTLYSPQLYPMILQRLTR